MTRRNACLIFNPSAGKGDPVEDLVAIREVLEPQINLDIRPTHEVSPSQLAREAIEHSAEIIIVSGGDGTVSAASEAVINTGILFGIIPRGTVNAFAQALGIPTGIQDACKTILTGIPRKVDVALCNGKPMIVLTAIGFEAETIKQTDKKAKELFGMLAFIGTGIKLLRHLDSFTVYVETEEQTINLSASAVTIANSAAPTSILAHGPAGVIIDDGLLDVTIVAPVNRQNALFAGYHLLRSGFTGTATNRDDIRHLRAKNVRVRTEPPKKVALDGDMNGNTPVEIKCIPGGLTVLVPSVSE
ncbi:YegS/Rv2252/BmrU family lipid kinase [Komarekiella sp. 'clone 1']|uniref:YegS/Rv2252/BmrU family lipid kinase n=1 Tax=Komarekiella delphini-convector SJRDD-AB1 TaxID=2593771 RepID=A0AA40STB9_9NOST|nr:YegS/Rv2252/BmrU family lipid kinase [Komarekiella delphini-convector]MBD6614856.1 YegS/Rv2252/BmrU family lipid kinase [Komarekiella delphini-convector SJRDD-AB1]